MRGLRRVVALGRDAARCVRDRVLASAMTASFAAAMLFPHATDRIGLAPIVALVWPAAERAHGTAVLTSFIGAARGSAEEGLFFAPDGAIGVCVRGFDYVGLWAQTAYGDACRVEGADAVTIVAGGSLLGLLATLGAANDVIARARARQNASPTLRARAREEVANAAARYRAAARAARSAAKLARTQGRMPVVKRWTGAGAA